MIQHEGFLSKPLRGIIPPMITPLKKVDALDIDGLERLVEHILAGGVSGLFILGTTGEFSSISYQLRYELVERVCSLVGSRVPVLVGITDTAIDESVRLAEFAAEKGADAVVAAPPFYYASGQPELIEYYSNLNRRMPLPLYLYNMPVHTKVMIEPSTVKELASQQNIRGLKDSSANTVYFRSVQHAVKAMPDFELFMGPEEISSSIYTVGRYGSSYLKGLKCALSLMGICEDYIADPFHKFKAEERSVIEKKLQALNLF
ncbi:MAG: dihydrodipicolinate synthase family protein [Bacteroidales bacterium]|nr:dihydrodipicolinate synthase family protein [Bacteroidales bacterium]